MSCQASIDELNAIIANQANMSVGVASMNIIEEYMQEINTEIDLDRESMRDREEKEEEMIKDSLIEGYMKGANVGAKFITGKDFTLVYFITCFLPFLKPNIPTIKDSELKRARKKKISPLFDFPKQERPKHVDEV